MPKLGLTMTEGVLAEWTVASGARFKAGDCVFVVENDKAASEVAAEQDGVMGAPLVAVGQTVAVGEVVGHWDDGLDAPVPAAPAAAPATVPAAAALPAGRRAVTPWARQFAKRHGVDLSSVAGSGPRGRVRGRDVEAARSRLPDGAGVAAPIAEAAPVPAVAPSPPALPTAGRVLPFDPLRRRVAASLVAVKQQAPHFYLVREAEVSALLELYARLKDPEAEPRITLNHFIVAAVGRALVAHPDLNLVWCEEGALRLDAPDVGVAVNTERGLVVPVVRNAGRLGLGALARQANALVERARSGRLSSDEMGGGAITVSNAGMHGLAAMASIIVPGQAMILGVGAVRELFRPDAQGAPALRREITLTLSVDHRVLDGVAGAALLGAMVDALAHPTRLLFD
ncbi:MAG: 2-oxo acid dehydrogenase subunit E2 [Burkholderiaceae bacterium]|nr:2-oxo acid dehydrogenase subunit E2 [Burkholderiaceae bacterium]